MRFAADGVMLVTQVEVSISSWPGASSAAHRRQVGIELTNGRG